MTMASLTQENIPLELVYRLRGLVHCRHGGKHGVGRQTWAREGDEGSASAGSRKRDTMGLDEHLKPQSHPQ